jgi:DNA primase
MSSPREDFGDLKERIRAATDIVELVGQYLKLRRGGSNWVGLCPFHNEKTPSFNVNPQRQNYYCFGCHNGGDVFSFVMHQEGLEFRESLEFLAKRAGIPYDSSFKGSGGGSRQELLARINESSAEFYHKLLVDSPQGERALEYLSRRGISRESIEAFQIGFAEQAWRQLSEHLHRSEFPMEACLEVGLVKKKSSGSGHYDTFRNRIIFPIRSVAGRVLGFGARVMDDSLPKYINSADSAVYTKKRVLYGLDRTWREIRKQKLALLVEGYFDVISLHQEGLPLAVASCGTAFSEDQAKLLGRYSDRMCIVTDGDNAGRRAAVKVAGLCLQKGGRPRIASLEAGEDPDSIIRKIGKEALSEQLSRAPEYFEYMRQLVQVRGDKPVDRERAIRRLLEDLATFADGDLHLESLLEELSTVFGVEIRVLKRALREVRRPERKRRGDGKDAEGDQGEGKREPSKSDSREKILLRILLDGGTEREKILKILSPEHFTDPLRARIFTTLATLGRVPKPAELGELFPDPAASAAVNELTFLELPKQGQQNWARTGALRLKLQALLELNRDFQGRVQAMELAGESVPPDLLSEWRHVGESIRELRSEIDQIQDAQKGT